MILTFTGREIRRSSSVSRLTRLIFYSLCFLLLASCNDKDFTFGNNFLESQTHMVLIDTTRVRLSTVVLDSVATSSSNVMLLGSYKDPAGGGDINCNGFFRVGAASLNIVNSDYYYDSLVLSLKYSGYILGDTTQDMDLSVYRTNQLLEPFTDGYYYSNTKVDYDTTNPLGAARFRPYPGIIKRVGIRLDDNIGKELFDSLGNKSVTLFSDESFQIYFRDLAIISNAGASTPIMGFSAKTGDLELRVYVHTTINDITVQDTVKFPIYSTADMFTQIYHNYPDSALAGSKDQRDDIPSARTGDKTYIEGGLGLVTKIEFTGMPDLLLNENGMILKAELVIRPDESTYKWPPLPGTLVFYNTDKVNRFNSQLLDLNNYQQPRPVIYTPDEFYHESASYTVDITDFILGEASDHYFDTDHGLIITIPNNDFLTTFNRLVISARPGQTQLRIYYLYYN